MTTIRKGSVLRLAALGLALGLVAAACGDDSGGAADTTAAATTAAATTAKPADTTAKPADTTAKPTGTTAAATTTAKAEPAFAINASACPEAATAALAAGAPIKIAFVGPQTGPLAGFGLIGKGLDAYFKKVNEAGGVDGHQVELIQKDDAYDAARTTTAVQELIEKDQISASLLQVGTPNVAAVRAQYETSCTPQAFVGTGFPAWGDPAKFQFTVGGILAYSTEAKIWSEYIAKNYPKAKVGVLTYNNDFGKSYSTTLEAEGKTNGFEVTNVFHEATSTLNNEITQILATSPDVIVGATTATFCGELVKQARQGGFEGPIIISATCFSSQFLDPAGEAATNVFGTGYLKDPSDPQYANDKAVQTYLADIAKYGGDANPNISSVATAYNFGALMVDVLKEAAKGDKPLSRVAIQNAVWNTNTVLPLAYDGALYKINGNNDGYGVEFAEMRQFVPGTGGAGGTFKSTGETFDLEGQTGLWSK